MSTIRILRSPNPPTAMLAPLRMSATAASAVGTDLSIAIARLSWLGAATDGYSRYGGEGVAFDRTASTPQRRCQRIPHWSAKEH